MSGLDAYNWYPQGVAPDLTISPYGAPNDETIACLTEELPPGARILDLAGGYGRYAIPLAERGYNVTIVDIDPPHLMEARRRAGTLPRGSGQIQTIEADVVRDDIFDKYDALLCAGFIYLAPTGVARAVMHRATRALKKGGRAVIEFATNRERRTTDGDSLIGEREENYTRRQGELRLRRFFAETGMTLTSITPKVIHLDEPYFLRTDLLIASGTKK